MSVEFHYRTKKTKKGQCDGKNPRKPCITQNANYDCKQKSKLTFQLDIKFTHFQLFPFLLADLQWRHLSANKSTLWWHSGLSRPGEDSTLLCNISLLSSFLVIQTVGNWKTEGWHQIEVQQNQTKSPMRVLFVNSLNKSKSMVREGSGHAESG